MLPRLFPGKLGLPVRIPQLRVLCFEGIQREDPIIQSVRYQAEDRKTSNIMVPQRRERNHATAPLREPVLRRT